MKRLTFKSFSKKSLKKSPTPTPDIPFETKPTKIRYKVEGSSGWNEVIGTAMSVPDTNRIVHTVAIEDLQPDTGYEFQTSTSSETLYLTWNGNPSTSMVIHWHTLKPLAPNGYGNGFSSNIHKFKTAPTLLTEKFKVAQISDTHGGGNHLKQVFDRIGSHGVRVIVHSGDIATGNGGSASPNTWYSFFEAILHAKDSEGYIIPMLANIGNHEILDGHSGLQFNSNGNWGIKPNFETRERGDAEWYYCFFPSFPGLQGYGKIDFGDYLSIWQIDPGITTRIDDGQDVWLQNSLLERSSTPNKLISLHYSPWMVGRRHSYSYNNAVRNTLCPIWEEFQPIVFTGHDHVWSVSPPIKGGTISEPGINYEEGTYYLGAGTAGTGVREARNPHTKWWIDNCIGLVWGYFDFENPDAPGFTTERREPHPADGTTFDWQEGSHYWLFECDYSEKIMTAYNAYNQPIHSFTIAN